MQKKKAKVTELLAGARLDLAVSQLFHDLSRKRAKRLIDGGGVYLNGRRVLLASQPVGAGSLVEVYISETEGHSHRGSSPALNSADLIAEEKDFIVVNKPAGIPSQAQLHTVRGSIIEHVERDLGIGGELFLVHRLDKETSGLLIIARNKSAKTKFEELFRKHMVKKRYFGLACGVPQSNRGTVIDFIVKDSLGHNRYRIGKGAGAKKSETRYRVVSVGAGGDTSLIDFTPLTGRTHQIRVHAAQSLGVPLMGDKTYAAQVIGHPHHRAVGRHMLHAASLKFPHFDTGEWKEYICPLPADFKTCLKNCGFAGEIEEAGV